MNKNMESGVTEFFIRCITFCILKYLIIKNSKL